MADLRWESDLEDPVLLRRWLHVATKGLCTSASERIREEVTSHYDGAMEELLGHGMSWVIADEKAVKHLGDAKKANREYRKIYFTREEERLLAQYSKSASPKMWYITLAILAVVFLLYPAHETKIPFLASWLVFLPICYTLVPAIGRRSTRAGMYVSASSGLLFFLIDYVVVFGRPVGQALLGLSAFVGGYLLTHYSVFKKINTNNRSSA